MRYDKNCSNHIGQKVKSEKFDFVILIPNDRNQCNEFDRRRSNDLNEKYVVVKYVDSDERILKENIIRDVMVGSTYIPEILPVINDREGKEWVCEQNQLLSLNVSNDNSRNEIEVKYRKKIFNFFSTRPNPINFISLLWKEFFLSLVFHIFQRLFFQKQSHLFK